MCGLKLMKKIKITRNHMVGVEKRRIVTLKQMSIVNKIIVIVVTKKVKKVRQALKSCMIKT